MSVYLIYFKEIKKDGKWIPLKEDGKLIENSKTGYPRDYLSTRGWGNCPFTGRGIPEDVSEEIKEKLQSEDMKYCCYDISYCTLNELESYYDTLEKEYQSSLKNVLDETVLRQLKYIFNKDITDPETTISITEEVEENFDALLQFNRLIGGISESIEDHFNNGGWCNDNNTRIIFWFG